MISTHTAKKRRAAKPKHDKIFDLIEQEDQRLRDKIGLIPSENHFSPAVASVLSTSLSSKYSEGMVDKRYYEGNQIIDQIELEARKRIKKVFDVEHVNVQPYSGSPANTAIQFALLEPGDTVMGLKLEHGGHITHGLPKVSLSGTFFKSVQFTLGKNGKLDFDQIRELVIKHKPKLIICGFTAYPYIINFSKFRKIADEVDAWLMADISHFSGLVAAGEHPSPVPHVDVVMSTTHKTFRGPRGAMIMVTKRGLKRDPDLPKRIDSAIIPGTQGGPHNATTAGIAIAAAEASTAAFRKYGRQVRKNADSLAEALSKQGVTLVGGGTQTHLMLIDLTDKGYGLGTQVAYALDVAGIYANRNTIPNEPCSPFYPSGLRIGTPLVTTRGMKIIQMRKIAKWIAQVIEHVKEHELPKDKAARAAFIKKFKKQADKDPVLLDIAKEVKAMAEKYPLFVE